MNLTAMRDRLGDAVNPIAVKEMRQAVKGRVLVWMLILYLLSQLVIMGVGVLFSEFDRSNFNAGRELLSVLLVALLLVCLLFLPAIFSFRLASECTQNRIDLLFVTDMSPYSIIWGKTLAGIVLTLLLFSASMPFLTLTYLLRGVDLPSIFITLLLDFAIVIITIQAALLLACFPGGIISRGLRFLFGLGGAFVAFSLVSSLSFGLMQSGIGSSLGSWEFWGPALTVAGGLLLGMGLLFVLSAVMISPPSSNKSLPIRIYMSLIWCCSTAYAFIWYYNKLDADLFELWVTLMSVLFSLVFLIALTERHNYGPRLLRAIPRHPLLRIPLFLLYSGSAGGVAYSLLMMGLTLGTFYLVTYDGSFPTSRVFQEGILVVCLYVVCYGFTALFLRRVLLPDQESHNRSTLVILFILLAATSLCPFLIAWFFVYHKVDLIPHIWYIGNPMIVFLETKMLATAMQFTLVWALIAVGLNIPWFTAQIRAFKPMSAAEELFVEPAAVQEEAAC